MRAGPEKLAATRGLTTLVESLGGGDPYMAQVFAAATECLDPLTMKQLDEVRQTARESSTPTLPAPDSRQGEPRARRRISVRLRLPSGSGSGSVGWRVRRFKVPEDAQASQVLARLIKAVRSQSRPLALRAVDLLIGAWLCG